MPLASPLAPPCDCRQSDPWRCARARQGKRERQDGLPCGCECHQRPWHVSKVLKKKRIGSGNGDRAYSYYDTEN